MGDDDELGKELEVDGKKTGRGEMRERRRQEGRGR